MYCGGYIRESVRIIVVEEEAVMPDRLQRIKKDVESLRARLQLLDDLEWTVSEIERLTREHDALLACRHGEQRCNDCPDYNCCDNMNPLFDKRSAEAEEEV